MMTDIYEIEQDKVRREVMSRRTLCKTLGGIDCEMLTITEKGDYAEMQAKQAVVISGRVHPGEVVGSSMMRGVLNFLTDIENEEAKLLRKTFIFKVIPMLNPDGVITGNYRCSLGGYDLNRQWLNPTMKASPEIYALKDMIKKTLECRKIELFVDIHGHSRQKNLFIYGCSR